MLFLPRHLTMFKPPRPPRSSPPRRQPEFSPCIPGSSRGSASVSGAHRHGRDIQKSGPGDLCFGVQNWLWRKVDAQIRRRSHGAEKTGFEQIKAGAPIHLSLDELQFCVLSFRLAIRPWLSERRFHRGLILNDA